MNDQSPYLPHEHGIIRDAFVEGRATATPWDQSRAYQEDVRLSVLLHNEARRVLRKGGFNAIPYARLNTDGVIQQVFPSRLAAAEWLVEEGYAKTSTTKGPTSITGNLEMCARAGWKSYGFYWLQLSEEEYRDYVLAEAARLGTRPVRVMRLNRDGTCRQYTYVAYYSSLVDCAEALYVESEWLEEELSIPPHRVLTAVYDANCRALSVEVEYASDASPLAVIDHQRDVTDDDAVASAAKSAATLHAERRARAGLSVVPSQSSTGTSTPSVEFDPAVHDILIAEFGLSVRATNGLHNGRVMTVGQLVTKSKRELYLMRGLGMKSINEIIAALQNVNLTLAPDQPNPFAWTVRYPQSKAGSPQIGG